MSLVDEKVQLDSEISVSSVLCLCLCLNMYLAKITTERKKKIITRKT